jgi:ATP-dependent DNA helicase RecG
VLTDDVTILRGIGPKKALQLKLDAGIETIEDLIYYIPRRYIDRSFFKLIKDCFVNETVTVSGKIIDTEVTGRRKKYLEVTIDDGTDTITGVFFGAVGYFNKIFTAGDSVIFSGKINFYRSKQIVHPEFDFIEDGSGLQGINTGRIIPLYRSTENLKSIGFDSRGFRRVIKSVLDTNLNLVRETIAESVLGRHSLIGIREALYGIHFPVDFEQAEKARRRLAFNEVFFHQYYLSLSRRYLRETKHKKGATLDEEPYRRFISTLPFSLTDDQTKVIEEIRKDISSAYPMNRMLQGDVGSGKTVVAMSAVMMASGQGRQSALMAPTEILARQHYQNFQQLIGSKLKIEILTGGMKKGEKKRIYEIIASGEVDLVIGTHALIQDDVSFRDLGLIIIDEQHRFGVDQRSILREKGDLSDLLVMSATPIPRSLSLTVYGDLNVSSIRTMPANRIPIKTMAFEESRLSGVYKSMEKYILQGRQTYYVLPLIEDSEKIDLKSAMKAFEHLKNEVFQHRRVELLHGRMKQEQRDEIMLRFKNGEIDVLVCTTVVEVGIDVPNANIIVIEHAERFGLAQLHQLRGRVGRGDHQSFCILVSPDSISDESRTRINTIVSTNDGFIIAEQDLKMRGAGELIGMRQSGHGGSFEFADLSLDLDLILYAREIAETSVMETSEVSRMWEEFKNKKYSQLVDGIRNKKLLSMIS